MGKGFSLRVLGLSWPVLPFVGYTQRNSKLGRQVGLKAAENRLKKGLPYCLNTAALFLIDFRRFEPACRPNFESRWV